MVHRPTVELNPIRTHFDSTVGDFRYAAQKLVIPAAEIRKFHLAGARYAMLAGTNKESGAGVGTPITVAAELPLIKFGDSGDFFRTRAGDWWKFSPVDRVFIRNALGANDIAVLLIWSNDPAFMMFDIAGVFSDRGVAQ